MSVAQKCPECGSTKVGVSELPSGGENRYGLICSECRWICGKCSSREDAYNQHGDVLLNWDKGVRVDKPGEHLDDIVRMVQGEKMKPSVGVATMEDLLGPRVKDVGAQFRTKEEQERYETGGVVPKVYKCEACKSTQQGAEVIGGTPECRENYYAAPAGWFLQHPSARLFCSMLCVKNDKDRSRR